MQCHIITGEYPPQCGGVSDYTRSVAMSLAAAGVEPHVWTRGLEEDTLEDANVHVHRTAGEFDRRSLHRLSTKLSHFLPSRLLLIQYVPHAFGYKGMNLPFAWWARSRAKRFKDDVRLMIHEVAYPWVKYPLRHNLLAFINEQMIRLMVGNCSRVYVSTSVWQSRLVRLGTKVEKIVPLPIPSNIPACTNTTASQLTRQRILGDRPNLKIVGHFGTFGKSVLTQLSPCLEKLLATGPKFHLLLIGAGSEKTRDNLATQFPNSKQLISATGRLSAEEISEHIAACDVMFQPYEDGVNTRRTSLMASLINGRATVSCTGPNCEGLWHENRVVELAERTTDDMSQSVIRLIENDDAIKSLEAAGLEYYRSHFSLEHTVRKLLES